MEAIANVVMNRLGHDGFPDTVCSVVKQGHEQGQCQFSWWCDGRSDSAFEEDPYKISKEIARRALNLQLTDATGGALYFHHRNVNPKWAPAVPQDGRNRRVRVLQAARRRRTLVPHIGQIVKPHEYQDADEYADANQQTGGRDGPEESMTHGYGTV